MYTKRAGKRKDRKWKAKAKANSNNPKIILWMESICLINGIFLEMYLGQDLRAQIIIVNRECLTEGGRR